MFPETAPELPETDVLSLIQIAKNAEICRDIDSLQGILQTLCSGTSVPSFSEYDAPIRAELLRLYGFYLTFGGRAKNEKDCQSAAKDLLTCAIDIFDSLGLADKAAESKIILAFCYWNRGEVFEADALLGLVENDFCENLLHPVFLQLKINRMMLFCWCEKYAEARQIVEEISPSIDLCADLRLRTMFHFEAAILFHRQIEHKEAIFHFSESVRLAKESGNQHLLALTYNNLSLLYLDMKQTPEAHGYSDKSLEILRKINHTGWIPHILDSKALIYLEEKKAVPALKRVEEALEFFYQGEDYKGLTASLWTKSVCLLRLGRTEEALIVFAHLVQIAMEKISESAAEKFARRFAEEIYPLRHLPFPEETAEFKKSRIAWALKQTTGSISRAARTLGLKNHQALSDILNNQFSGLYEKLGFRRRTARKAKERNCAKSRTVMIASENILDEAEISQLALPDKNFTFDFPCSAGVFQTFYFDRFMMKKFGIESGAIVAVVPVAEIKAGMLLLMSDDNDFTLAKAEYDSWARVFYITGERGEPLPLGAEQVVGEPVGYCLIKDADNKFIEFSRLL